MNAARIRCSVPSCEETYPAGDNSEHGVDYERGRWLGWVYLDLNRPDLASGALPFCDIRCLKWWIWAVEDGHGAFRTQTLPDVLLRGQSPDELGDRKQVGAA